MPRNAVIFGVTFMPVAKREQRPGAMRRRGAGRCGRRARAGPYNDGYPDLIGRTGDILATYQSSLR
ncbi:hypothetical protein GCM10022419_111680 [Nonomuraea rosea]|uniref:Uncharacterized protein n=1 Tax=Nonomuraea rosea TaxID=638574 RepID=A0ABP6ZG00_9ACTN